MAAVRLLALFTVTALLLATTFAEIRFRDIRSDSRSTIPIDWFGFTHTGRLQLSVSKFCFSYYDPKPDLSQVGFFLCTRDSWSHVLEEVVNEVITCPFQSKLIKPVFTFDKLQGQDSYDTSYNISEANQFTLVFGKCVPDLKISMAVRSSMYNIDAKTNRRDYLSAGRTNLPSIFFIFFLIYSSLAGIWICVLYNKRLSAFRIHYFMLDVLILKALNLLCIIEDKSYIKKTGNAHGWDVLFYIFSFLKGITFFTLIVLIGTRRYSQDTEKKVLIIMIPLQVIANVAQVVIDKIGPFGQNSYTWKQVFLLVDVICCCAVLFPISRSIKNLREAARTDGKAAVNLMKLTLLRRYYIAVICYICFTRIVVYALQTITSYRYQWTSVVAAELATLAFYLFTGYNLRPKVHNPYFAIDDEDEEAATEEPKKLEDDFE